MADPQDEIKAAQDALRAILRTGILVSVSAILLLASLVWAIQ